MHLYKLSVKERAKLMVDDAYAWYEDQSEGLGEAFLKELELCINKILANPELYGFIENSFRCIRLKRFPYIIIYELLGNEVVVYAVFHTRRNPSERFGDNL